MFEQAFEIGMKKEGKYSNHPNDKGGETYKGVARKANPDWHGWLIVDNLRREPGFPNNLDDNKMLQTDVRQLYKEKYFDAYNGDNMPQMLAIEMFDTAINMGVPRSVKFLQEVLNGLNKNQTLYPDITIDGNYGPQTEKTLNTYIEKRKGAVARLVKCINILQGAFYFYLMKKDPTQEIFAEGWLDHRVTIEKRR